MNKGLNKDTSILLSLFNSERKFFSVTSYIYRVKTYSYKIMYNLTYEINIRTSVEKYLMILGIHCIKSGIGSPPESFNLL